MEPDQAVRRLERRATRCFRYLGDPGRSRTSKRCLVFQRLAYSGEITETERARCERGKPRAALCTTRTCAITLSLRH